MPRDSSNEMSTRLSSNLCRMLQNDLAYMHRPVSSSSNKIFYIRVTDHIVDCVDQTPRDSFIFYERLCHISNPQLRISLRLILTKGFINKFSL